MSKIPRNPDTDKPLTLGEFKAAVEAMTPPVPKVEPEAPQVPEVVSRAQAMEARARKDAAARHPSAHTIDREGAKDERRNEQLGTPVAPGDAEQLALAGIQAVAPPREGEGLQRISVEEQAAGAAGLAEARASLAATQEQEHTTQQE